MILINCISSENSFLKKENLKEFMKDVINNVFNNVFNNISNTEATKFTDEKLKKKLNGNVSKTVPLGS